MPGAGSRCVRDDHQADPDCFSQAAEEPTGEPSHQENVRSSCVGTGPGAVSRADRRCRLTDPPCAIRLLHVMPDLMMNMLSRTTREASQCALHCGRCSRAERQACQAGGRGGPRHPGSTGPPVPAVCVSSGDRRSPLSSAARSDLSLPVADPLGCARIGSTGRSLLPMAVIKTTLQQIDGVNSHANPIT